MTRNFPDMQETTIQHLTPRKLSQRFGGTERWWQRYLPELHKAGKIGKRGRLFFGELTVIEQWLLCTEEANERYNETSAE
jgi:hypothetical protein